MDRTFSPMELRRTGLRVLGGVAMWGAAVAAASASGLLGRVTPIEIGPLIAMGLAIPPLVYFRSPKMRALARQIGVHRLTVFQSWRVVGTLAFFSYGAKNVLPPLFVREAAWGDLITALAAASLAILPRTRFGYAAVNVIGALDFLVAVSLGVALTLMHDARMATNATFPIALIPLFGVGVSFAVHLIAFDVLRDTQPESQRVEPTLLRSSEGRA